MNNLLVLTNFSSSSYNASLYAMHIAKSVKANVILCHVINSANDSLRRENMANLKALADKLMKEDFRGQSSLQYNPVIEYVCKTGKVADVAKQMFDEVKISLVVMGMPGSGGLSRLFSQSETSTLVETADFPLLVVPAKAAFIGVQKIAFATHLNEADTQVVTAIAEIARPLNTEILLAHVTNEKFDNNEHKKKVNQFISTVNHMANYAKIYYRHIKSADTAHGLGWLASNGNVNMLATVHRSSGALRGAFSGGYNKQLAKSSGLPLLVYPMSNVLEKAV